MEKTIKVGIGVMLFDNNKILLGHRVPSSVDTGGIYEPDSWTFPGGKQEFSETILEAAIRETKEETNLDIKDISLLSVTDDFQKEKHYITIGVISSSYEGKLKVMEPDKIDRWEWFELDDLPDNIYSPSKKMIDEYFKREGK